MNSSSMPYLAGSTTVPKPIPNVLLNFGRNIGSRDTVRKSKNGFNAGVGMGFDSNGEIALNYYTDSIPEGKSGFISRFTTEWEFGVSTPIELNWSNLRQYDGIEDCIWFYCINPPPIDISTSNITRWNGVYSVDVLPFLTQFMAFPISSGCIFFIVKNELWTSATNFGFSA